MLRLCLIEKYIINLKNKKKLINSIYIVMDNIISESEPVELPELNLEFLKVLNL